MTVVKEKKKRVNKKLGNKDKKLYESIINNALDANKGDIKKTIDFIDEITSLNDADINLLKSIMDIAKNDDLNDIFSDLTYRDMELYEAIAKNIAENSKSEKSIKKNIENKNYINLADMKLLKSITNIMKEEHDSSVLDNLTFRDINLYESIVKNAIAQDMDYINTINYISSNFELTYSDIKLLESLTKDSFENKDSIFEGLTYKDMELYESIAKSILVNNDEEDIENKIDNKEYLNESDIKLLESISKQMLKNDDMSIFDGLTYKDMDLYESLLINVSKNLNDIKNTSKYLDIIESLNESDIKLLESLTKIIKEDDNADIIKGLTYKDMELYESIAKNFDKSFDSLKEEKILNNSDIKLLQSLTELSSKEEDLFKELTYKDMELYESIVSAALASSKSLDDAMEYIEENLELNESDMRLLESLTKLESNNKNILKELSNNDMKLYESIINNVLNSTKNVEKAINEISKNITLNDYDIRLLESLTNIYNPESKDTKNRLFDEIDRKIKEEVIKEEKVEEKKEETNSYISNSFKSLKDSIDIFMSDKDLV